MGASIALIRDGRIIDTFQYGRANRADNIPVDSETYFRLASISKMITAVGVLQLVEQGVLSLDADLGDYYPFPIRNPYFPDTPITLRHLMSHTSSLSDGYHYDMAIKGEITRLEFVFDGNYTDMNYQRWEPGTRVSYSNFGGGMLGALIEQTTGYLIDEYMTFSVFAPLGVAGGYHTPCLPPGAKLARLYNVESTGMTLDPATLTDCDMDADGQTSYTHSAGGLTMTAEGVAKVLIAIAGDGSSYGVQLLQPQTVAHRPEQHRFRPLQRRTRAEPEHHHRRPRGGAHALRPPGQGLRHHQRRLLRSDRSDGRGHADQRLRRFDVQFRRAHRPRAHYPGL